MTQPQFPYPEAEYSVRIAQEPATDGETVFSAWYVELPGCESQGDTEAEARENLRDAFALYVGDLLESGREVPAPQRSQVHEIVSYTSMDSGTAECSAPAGPLNIIEVDASDQIRRPDGSTPALASGGR